MGAVMASITGGRVMGKSDKGAAGVAARPRAAWLPWWATGVCGAPRQKGSKRVWAGLAYPPRAGGVARRGAGRDGLQRVGESGIVLEGGQGERVSMGLGI